MHTKLDALATLSRFHFAKDSICIEANTNLGKLGIVELADMLRKLYLGLHVPDSAPIVLDLICKCVLVLPI